MCRKKLKYWWRMARGKSAAEDYLTLEGTEWDKHNRPKKQRKAERIDNFALVVLLIAPYAGIGIYYFLPGFVIWAVLGIIAHISLPELFKYVRVLQEIRRYSSALCLRIFYQYSDGRQGEVELIDCKISDRLVIKPRELVRRLEEAEHIIQSGVDERQLMAQIGKMYLPTELKTKVEQLEELTRERDQGIREALKSVVILRKYFNFGKDDPELQKLFGLELQKRLDEIQALFSELSRKDKKLKRTLSKQDKKSKKSPREQEITAAEIVSAWIQKKEALTDSGVGKSDKADTELVELERKAKEKDTEAIELLKKLDIIRRFYTVGLYKESGETEETEEADQTPRYEPHIYTVYPNKGDLKGRCVLVSPYPFSEMIHRDSNIEVRFDYTYLAVPGSDLEAIRLDESVMELLVNGQTQHGVQIKLPTDTFAVTTETPIFVITRCDATEEQLRQAQRLTLPPSIIGLFTKAVRAIIDHEWLAEKLAKAYSRIRQLEESKDEDRTTEETDETEHDLHFGHLIDEPGTEKPEQKKRAISPWLVVAGFVAGVIAGALGLWVVLRLLGWSFLAPGGGVF